MELVGLRTIRGLVLWAIGRREPGSQGRKTPYVCRVLKEKSTPHLIPLFQRIEAEAQHGADVEVECGGCMAMGYIDRRPPSL